MSDERRAPLPVYNRPGLDALSRRIGTHATVKVALLHGLSRPDLPALADLTARGDDDFAVALLDTAATAVDVVTFAVERYVNEHYLRTATEPRSLAELGRLVGYQPRPGIAATTDLVFTLQVAPGAPAEVRIPVGTAVQSSPDPGELPVVFETTEEVLARPAFNALRPRQRLPHPITADRRLSFAGTATNLRVGDGVLYRTGPLHVEFGVVETVRVVDAVPDLPGRPGAPGHTDVTMSAPPPTCVRPPDGGLLPYGRATVPRRHRLYGTFLAAEDLDSVLATERGRLRDVAGSFGTADPNPVPAALVFRRQDPLFGHQAPLAVSGTALPPTYVDQWAGITVASFPGAQLGTLRLDGAHPEITAGSQVVLRSTTGWGCYQATEVAVESVAALGLSGRATRLRLDTGTALSGFPIRQTTAYAQPDLLPLAGVPAPAGTPVDVIELDGLALGLRAGRRVVVTGEPVDDPGNVRAHATTIAEVRHDLGAAPCTVVTLARFLPGPLLRGTVRIAANVAPATQGQTRREPLGSGAATVAFQRFTLRQPPLTFLSADTPAGLASTLTIRVDGVRWTEVRSLVEAGPHDRVYVLEVVDGVPTVQFGDGRTGARLPTGTANVHAEYRTGSGLEGRVDAGKLTMPLSRVGGVTEVTNPAAAVGGDDPEGVDAARVNVPLRVRTLDRVVSLADYADYARAFPGVAKATAVWARAGNHRGVLLTVAGAGGAVVGPSDPIGANLRTALRTAGDPLVAVGLVPYRPRPFRLAVQVKVAADRDRAVVLADAEAALRRGFSFPARDLGQPVARSALLALLHAVPGVVAATVTGLWRYPPGSGPGPAPDLLTAEAPAPGSELGPALAGAELLTLDTAPIQWGVLA